MYFYFVALALFVLSSFFPVYFPFSESKTATSVDTRSSSSSPSLLFFSPDVHDGTMTDLAASLTAFNHSVFFYNYKCSLPAYSEMKRRVVTDQQYVMQDLKQEQPQILFPTKVICKTNKLFSYNMDSVHRIWKLFRGNRVFQQVDAILCMFYPSECQNYIVFNKTVVFIPAHRFLIRRCYNNDSSSLLKWMFNQPKAPVVVMAAGRYDAEYINYYSGKNVPYIISSTILLYTPPVIYSPIWNEFLYAPFKNNIHSKKYKQMVTDACTREGKPCFLVNIRERVKGRFHYRDINKFKAAVSFHMQCYPIIWQIWLLQPSLCLFHLLHSLWKTRSPMISRQAIRITVELSFKNLQSIQSPNIHFLLKTTQRMLLNIGFDMLPTILHAPLFSEICHTLFI